MGCWRYLWSFGLNLLSNCMWMWSCGVECRFLRGGWSGCCFGWEVCLLGVVFWCCIWKCCFIWLVGLGYGVWRKLMRDLYWVGNLEVSGCRCCSDLDLCCRRIVFIEVLVVMVLLWGIWMLFWVFEKWVWKFFVEV